MKEKLTVWLQTSLINPLVLRHAGDRGNRYAVLETVGRKSGVARRTPVANGLKGDVFWIVAERGANASYVKNLTANPRVRVKADGTWRTGVAHAAPTEDPESHLKDFDPRTANELRRFGSRLMTLRVDLDPA